MEKEKNKSPSYAMRISVQINKVVWSMLVDGKSFAEAEINEMVSKNFCIVRDDELLIMTPNPNDSQVFSYLCHV